MRFTRREQVSEAIGLPFSEQQLDAITAPLEPGVVIAGAGSGKTAVMAARVVWLVGTGQVRPEQVLGLTFTRKAAAELSARVRGALLGAGVVDTEGEDDAGEQLVMTYDAFAGRLVGDHGLRLGVDSDLRLITGAVRHRLAWRVVAAASGPFQKLSRLQPKTLVDRLLQLDQEMSAHLVRPDDVRSHGSEFRRAVEESPRTPRGRIYVQLTTASERSGERDELLGLVEAYQALKAELGYVEFADQMAVAARLARSAPEVADALRQEFRVVLLDEYQDTSSAQAELLLALFGAGHPVTAVGDPCQAIYGWRGAAASNIITFADTFRRADGTPAKAYPLTVNRRSGQHILDAANRLATPLRADDALRWEGIDADLVAPDGTPPGDITTATFDTWEAEVAWIADRIVAARDAGVVGAWGDMAVLARRNANIGAVYAALRERNVPVEIVGLDGLLSVPEVADVVATLEAISDPTANAAVVRLLTGPRWRLGPADLLALGRRAYELARVDRPTQVADFTESVELLIAGLESTRVASLAEAVADLGDGPYSSAGRRRLGEFAAELAALRRHTAEPVSDLVRRVIAVLGLEVELRLRGPDGLAQLEAFAAAVGDYTAVDGDGSLPGLLAYLDAEREYGVGLEQAVPEPADAVRLMTIHKAKGLEWPMVFLPALAQTVFPSSRVQSNWLAEAGAVPGELRGDADSIPQLAEVSEQARKEFVEALRAESRRGDDRLAYVAVTRAKQHLIVTTHAWAGTRVNRLEPSDYLDIIQPRAERALEEPVSEQNPMAGHVSSRPWPAPLDAAQQARRLEAADAVEGARAALRAGRVAPDPTSYEIARRAAEWDAAASHLVTEARQARSGAREVLLPRYLSTSAVLALHADPQEWASQIARPMPRPPMRASRVGEQFHAWLERRFASVSPLGLIEEVPPTDADLATLIEAFEQGPFADRIPSAVEVPFALVLSGQVVRGRIDAVFDDESEPLVVDWKTGRRAPDPLQLAVYRLAWAELTGRAASSVAACFYDVRSGSVSRFDDLPDRAELERLMVGLVP